MMGDTLTPGAKDIVPKDRGWDPGVQVYPLSFDVQAYAGITNEVAMG